MRLARKLTLLALLAIGGAALAAPPALAQVEPELHNQTPRLIVQQEVHGAADVNCPPVTPSPPPDPSPNTTGGGCRQHYSASNVDLVGHLSAGGTEVLASTCNFEFDLRLDAAGEGWINHQEMTPGTTGQCTRAPCGIVNGEGRAWTTYLQETEVAGQGPRESVVMLTCTAPIADPTQIAHCEVTIPISQASTHRYRWTAADVSGHGAAFPHCEWTGTFDQEAALGATCEEQMEQNIEVRHN